MSAGGESPTIDGDQPPRAASARRRNDRGTGDRLREEIIDAALRLLETEPPSALTLRAVAREAGVTSPAIYLQFASRDEMILAVADAGWRRLAQEMERADQRSSRGGPYAQLRAQLRAYVDFALASRARYELLYALHPEADYEWPEHQASSFREVYGILERAVLRCRDAGYQMPGSANLFKITILLLSGAHGRVAISHINPRGTFSSAQQAFRTVEEFLRILVRPPAGEA